MSTAVSIIVPVYDVEKYLNRCLDSILMQTFNNFECILVNDCSNDNSPAICDEYVQKDKRINIIHNKKNMGLPSSRKIGLENSSGDYILYVDSDDYIEADMLEKMYSLAASQNYDMVYCDYYSHDKTNNVLHKKVSVLSDNFIHNLKNSVLDFNSSCVVWNKLVKKPIYDNVEFPVDGVFEDKYISTQLLFFSGKIGYVDAALYHYQYNPDSLTNAAGERRKYHELSNNFNKIFDFLKDKYGYDLSIFEPELGTRIKWIKKKNPKTLKNIIKKVLRTVISVKQYPKHKDG
jgi:glycosyltransferase involved in cell wall biosynthesis